MWTNEQRVIPDVELVPIIEGTAFSLRINFWGPGSSHDQEAQSLPLNGFGSCLFHDYLVLSVKKALAYIKEHNLRLHRNDTTVAGVAMLVYKPDNAAQRMPYFAADRNATHTRQRHAGPCVFCGQNFIGGNDECPAILEAMGFELPAADVDSNAPANPQRRAFLRFAPLRAAVRLAAVLRRTSVRRA